MSQPVIAVTSGEPAGIGPELCLRLAAWSGEGRPVVLGDRQLLQQRAELLGLDVTLRDYSPGVSASLPAMKKTAAVIIVNNMNKCLTEVSEKPEVLQKDFQTALTRFIDLS